MTGILAGLVSLIAMLVAAFLAGGRRARRDVKEQTEKRDVQAAKAVQEAGADIRGADDDGVDEWLRKRAGKRPGRMP